MSALTPYYELETDFTDGVTPYPGSKFKYLHRLIEAQLNGALFSLGSGVVPYPDATSFQVSDDTGRAVHIAIGCAVLRHASYGGVFLKTTAQATLTLPGDGTYYLYATVQADGSNDTRQTALPRFYASLSGGDSDALLLATVTAAGGDITGVVDNRSYLALGGTSTAWTSGSGVPAGGANGDLYLRTSNGDVYQRSSGTWSVVANIKGPAGATGPTGATGATGAAGAGGATWLSGTAAPDDGDGANNDWYINLTTLDIYKKVSGAWEIEANIKGPRGVPGGALSPTGDWLTATVYAVLDAVRNDGGSYFCKVGHTSGSTTEPGTGANWADYWTLYAQDGSTGVAGANGTAFFNGSGAPGGGVGANGDYYLDTDVLDLYQKAAGSWSIIVNLKAAGVGVPAGGTTGQILAKVNGTDYNTQWVPAPTGGGGGGGSAPAEVELTPSGGDVSFDPTASDLFYFTTGADVNIVFDATGAYDGQEILIKILPSADLALDFSGDVLVIPEFATPISLFDGYYHLRVIYDSRAGGQWVPYSLLQVYFVE